jgi:hypothetical protein
MITDPACVPLTVSVETAREIVRRLETDNPLWIVVFGVYSKEFVCFPRFTVPGGAMVAARHPRVLPLRLRHVENRAGRFAAQRAR